MVSMSNDFNKIGNEFSRKSEYEIALDIEIHKASENQSPYQITWQNRELIHLKRRSVERILFLSEMFQRIKGINGAIYELGVQWGPTLTTLTHLRGTFDTFNPSRVIRGFDTFTGLKGTLEKDDTSAIDGDYSTGMDHSEILDNALRLAELQSPMGHLRRCFLHVGDVRDTLPQVLEANQHETISLVFFDLDLYEPTKYALEHLLPRMSKGSVIVFDELSSPQFAGELKALNEVLGIGRVRIERSALQPYVGIVTL